VIRAREELGRLLRKRGLAAAVAALVVALVLLVSVHPISDNVVEHAGLVCAAAVLALGCVVAAVGQERRPAPRPPARTAGPSPPALLLPPALVFNEARSLPLRR
jgi:peptidoglycan/LPS O-acetylase OafA/YrhL